MPRRYVTRRNLIMQPGIAGMNRDDDPWLIQKNQSVRAQDAYVPNGSLQNIRGWKFDGTIADVADNLISVGRWQFAVADLIRTLTCDDDGDIYIHNAAGAGTLIYSGTVPYLPRCMYRDEVLWCAQDWGPPLLRYSGAVSTSAYSSGTFTLTTGEATVKGGVLTTTPDVGSFALLGAFSRSYHGRVLSGSTSGYTVEDIVASNTLGVENASAGTSVFGLAFPSVPVYEAGTISQAAGNLTGFGTKWNTPAAYTYQQNDHVLVQPPGANSYVTSILSTPASDTSISPSISNTFAKSPYKILRQLPFVDAAVHRGSLAGICGPDSPHPNTVYIGPQGWNISFPPGFVPPFDPSIDPQSSNPEDFVVFPLDVPTPFHGDPNIALISSPQGLIVPKRKDAHMVYGDYPNFSQRLWAGGAGCIDRRSAKSYAFGRIWAGESGVYVEDGGQPRDITEKTRFTGGINKDWRALTDGFVTGTDYCTAGETYGHLKLSIVTDGGTTAVTYYYDFSSRAWMSFVTRCKARYFFSSKIQGEPEKLLWVSDDQQGRVMDSAPELNGLGILKNGDGTAPRFQYDSTLALGESAGIEGDVLAGHVDVSANVLDLGAPGASKMNVSLEHGGGPRQGTTQEVKALGTIDSDTVDRVDRFNFRANRSGRYLQIKVDAATVGTNDVNTKFEVAEIGVSLHDSSSGT